MRKTLYIFLILTLCSVVAFAQQGTKTIIDDINTKKVGQGSIRIMQDETIDARLAQYHINTDTMNVIRLSNEQINGFKIQVYSGQSRNEAIAKQTAIREEFRQHQVQDSYNSPLWRVRVGNFLTRAEADKVLAEMKKAFPTFGREMYVVSDIIRRPLSR